jgi:ferredoxin
MSVSDKSFQLNIQPHGWQCDADNELTLLESASFSNIQIPNSCRNGTCRTCMCRMSSGRVRYQIEWPGLSAEEKQEGYILPCVAYPETDVVLYIPEATALSEAKQ